jgi:transposase-like protein
MEAVMKNYSEKERERHLEKWKNGSMSKAAYAKSVGIHPTTFYTWARGTGEEKQEFIEIKGKRIPDNNQEIVIEKDGTIIRLPLSADANNLQTVLNALGNRQ